MFVSLRIKKALQWDMWVWRHINRRRTRSCSADDFVKTQRNDSRTQSSKMEPRKWELMCAHPFGDYPKPFCHLVAWDTCYPKSKKKKRKIRDRTGFVSKLITPLLPRGIGKTEDNISGHLPYGKWIFLHISKNAELALSRVHWRTQQKIADC